MAANLLRNGTLLLSMVGFTTVCNAQTDVTWVGGTGSNWTTPENWDHPSDPDNSNGFLPTGSEDEVAVIANGGTAVLSADLSALGDGNGPPGEVVISGGSTLQLESGGIFSTNTAGDNVDGSVSVTSGGVLSVNGPSAGFLATGVTLNGGVYNPIVTNSTTHTALNVTGDFGLAGGTLRPEFTGFTPSVGNSWVLADAVSISGAFSVDLSQSNLPAGLGVGLSTISGGTNGQQLLMGVEAFAQLTVNADTGAATLSSPSGAAIVITGYGLASSSSQLNEGGWNTLASQLGGGWGVSGTPSSNNLDETAGPIPPANTTQDSATLTSTAQGIGSPFAIQPFGTTPDLTFEYTTSAGELRQGLVEFNGLNVVNNLLLTVDPSTGMAQLKNSSTTTIELEGYSILSSSGSLDAVNWDSLDSQNVDNSGVGGVDGFVQEASILVPSDENQLSELVPNTQTEERSLTLSPNESYNLGMLFDTSGTQDLELEFLINLGDVLTGDYNGDGTVNIADYTVWRDNLGGSESALANPGNGSGTVDAGDYTAWKDNFGASGSGGGGLTVLNGAVIYEPLAGAVVGSTAPVPEPSTAAGLLVLIFGVGLLAVAKRKPLMAMQSI